MQWITEDGPHPRVGLEAVTARCVYGMQGVRGSNPLSSTTGQMAFPPSTVREPRPSRSRYAATASARPIRSSRAASPGPPSPGSSPRRRGSSSCRRRRDRAGRWRGGCCLPGSWAVAARSPAGGACATGSAPASGSAAPGAVGPAGPRWPARLVAGQPGLVERARQTGGELSGPNPTDRGKAGSKYHLLVDRHGLPLAVGRQHPRFGAAGAGGGPPSSTRTRATTSRAAGGRSGGAASRRGLPAVASSPRLGWGAIGMWWSGHWPGWWAIGGCSSATSGADILTAFLRLAARSCASSS